MPSLRKLLTKAASKAFVATGDIPDNATLYLGAADVYDPIAGVTNQTFKNTVENVPAIPSSLTESENNVVIQKQTYIVQASALPVGVNLVPGVVKAASDYIAVDGVRYNIYEVRPDPLRITYTLLVRL